jgi:predicted PurR-regulated permease PerM
MAKPKKPHVMPVTAGVAETYALLGSALAPLPAAQLVANPPPSKARWNSWALNGILFIAAIAALKFARDLLLPIMVALILSLVFLPVVRGLKRLLIPAPIGAAIIVLGVFFTAFAGIYNLAEPANDWLVKAPQSLREMTTKLRFLSGSAHDVAAATVQAQSMAAQMMGAGSDRKIQQVTLQPPSVAGSVLGAAQEFAVSTARTFVLLYFLLASGNVFLRKVVAATPKLSDKKREIDIANQVEAAVSSYLFTVSLINVGLGAAVALAFYGMGVPNPMLWGAMVALFNFVPYLGEMSSLVILTIVGLLSFNELPRSLMLPIVFYLLSALEGYVITPLVLGKRLSLNPVVIVLSVLFWGWMWGVPGALLAVPILIATKTLCDRVNSLAVIGEFIGA